MYVGKPIKELISVNPDNVQNGAFRILTYNAVFQKTLSTKIGIFFTNYLDIHSKTDYLKVKKIRKMKKLKVAIFISDVGFGHMVRQREIIKVMLTKLKNVDITIINGLQIEILKETFKDKVKYIKRFNNIELMKSKEGYLDLKYTSKILYNWDQSIDESFKFFKKNFYNFNLIISDFVPEVFYFPKTKN